MDLLKILRVLLRGVPPSDHTVSVDGRRKGPVTKAAVSRDGGELHFDYEFQDDGQTRKVEAFAGIDVAGRHGGGDQILVDGQEVEFDDLVIAATFVGFSPVAKIMFRWKADGEPHEIRFDARVRLLPF